MFNQSAKLYDLIYHLEKDYVVEVEKLDYLLKQLDPQPKRILDVACGSGEHALQLRSLFGYEVDGIDIEEDFVEIARSKNPEAHFEVGDMTSFHLGQSYDTLLCLFSSIGYVETFSNLKKALGCMAKHLSIGGFLILEPWLEPQKDLSGLNTTIDAHDPKTGASITRRRTARLEGWTSVLDIQYEISQGESTTTCHETHRLGMFSRQQMEEAFASAGFASTYAEQGLHNKGIYLAKRVQ